MILSDRVTAKRPLLGVWAACSLGLLALPGWSLGQDAPADPAAVQKQLDEAIKQLEKAVPNAPAEVKKQFEDVRKQLQNLPAANANIFRIGGGNIQMMPAQPIFNIAFPADIRAGRIGAIVQPPDALVATQLQLPANSGQVVVDVVPGQPAAKAGILKHDILLEIAGKTVSNDPVAFRKEIDAIKTDAELRRIPVVVLTTSRDEDHILDCYDRHANAFVNKPVDFDEFLAVVRRIDDFFVSIVRLPSRERHR